MALSHPTSNLCRRRIKSGWKKPCSTIATQKSNAFRIYSMNSRILQPWRKKHLSPSSKNYRNCLTLLIRDPLSTRWKGTLLSSKSSSIASLKVAEC